MEKFQPSKLNNTIYDWPQMAVGGRLRALGNMNLVSRVNKTHKPKENAVMSI